MVLFENSIIKIDYDPATDILSVKYPDLHGYLLPEIKHSIDIIVENVRNYDVRKVLLDSTNTVVSVTPDESSEISIYLASGLSTTRVLKLARLQSLDTIVETRAKENIKTIMKSIPLPFQLKNFTNREDATAWLISE